MRVWPSRSPDDEANAVDIAENGDVALKKLQRPCKRGAHGYDLVLTDVFMPKVRLLLLHLFVTYTSPRGLYVRYGCMNVLVQVDGEALVKAILNSDFRNIPVAGAYLRKRPTPQCGKRMTAPVLFRISIDITTLLACSLTRRARAEQLYPHTVQARGPSAP